MSSFQPDFDFPPFLPPSPSLTAPAGGSSERNQHFSNWLLCSRPPPGGSRAPPARPSLQLRLKLSSDHRSGFPKVPHMARSNASPGKPGEGLNNFIVIEII